jgi:hypothetical protein
MHDQTTRPCLILIVALLVCTDFDLLGPVWTLTSGAAPCLSCGGRFGRHNCGTPSVARCGIGGSNPNMPLVLLALLQSPRAIFDGESEGDGSR